MLVHLPLANSYTHSSLLLYQPELRQTQHTYIWQLERTPERQRVDLRIVRGDEECQNGAMGCDSQIPLGIARNDLLNGGTKAQESQFGSPA